MYVAFGLLYNNITYSGVQLRKSNSWPFLLNYTFNNYYPMSIVFRAIWAIDALFFNQVN